MRMHLLEHLDDMVRAAALRADENSIALINQMKRMAERLPLYFEVPIGEPVDTPALMTAQPGRVGSFDTAKAIHAASQETIGRSVGDETMVHEAWRGEFHTDPSRIVDPDRGGQPLDEDAVQAFNDRKADEDAANIQEGQGQATHDTDAAVGVDKVQGPGSASYNGPKVPVPGQGSYGEQVRNTSATDPSFDNKANTFRPDDDGVTNSEKENAFVGAGKGLAGSGTRPDPARQLRPNEQLFAAEET